VVGQERGLEEKLEVKKKEKKGILQEYAVIRAVVAGSIPRCPFSARK
jgi:hypothetical protein